MPHRYRITVRYDLGARVRWAADPATVYVVERWRYVFGHTGDYVQCLIVREDKRWLMAWVHEVDLVDAEEGEG